MPYPRAHLYILALIPATFLGFWPTYFSHLGAVSPAFHVHGLSASIWIVLLAFQSWSIHNRRRNLHHQAGLFSLGLFPVFMAGFFMVLQTESYKLALGEDPLYVVTGPAIGAHTVIGIAATGYFFYAGLKHRRNVHLHARYLLTIPFLFIESVFGRIFNGYMPGLIINSVDDLPRAIWAIHITQALAIGVAMYLYFADQRYGRPFLIVSVVMVIQSLVMETLGRFDWWREVFTSFSHIPVPVYLITGLAFGAATAWFGWGRANGVGRGKGAG